MLKMFLCIFISSLLLSCNSNDQEEVPVSENDVDAARNFINAALDGHYDEARSLVVSDSSNDAWIDLFKRNYQSRMTMADKAGYRDASINIQSVSQPNDSTTIVHYSNSYKKKSDSLKVVRLNGKWLVDLKYSFASTDPDPVKQPEQPHRPGTVDGVGTSKANTNDSVR